MEIGQILHNNPVGLPCPDFVEALIVAIRHEIARVYWNVNQKAWRGAGLADIGGGVDPWSDEWRALSDDTGIPGVEWRPYYNWAGCPGDDDWSQDEADRPNFAFDGVEVRWYKNFGRSMNINREWSPHEWVAWFERCMDAVRVYENRSSEITHEEAIEHGNAPYRCAQCGRYFNWPAKRCGFDGSALIKYKLDAMEKREQRRRRREARKHVQPCGTPDHLRIVESTELKRGWRLVLAESTSEEFFRSGWYAVSLLPCGCEQNSFGASESMCRAEYEQRVAHADEMTDVELRRAERKHKIGWL